MVSMFVPLAAIVILVTVSPLLLVALLKLLPDVGMLLKAGDVMGECGAIVVDENMLTDPFGVICVGISP